MFSPTLLSCSSRFLRALQQNRAQSRLLYLLNNNDQQLAKYNKNTIWQGNRNSVSQLLWTQSCHVSCSISCQVSVSLVILCNMFRRPHEGAFVMKDKTFICRVTSPKLIPFCFLRDIFFFILIYIAARWLGNSRNNIRFKRIICNLNFHVNNSKNSIHWIFVMCPV